MFVTKIKVKKETINFKAVNSASELSLNNLVVKL